MFYFIKKLITIVAIMILFSGCSSFNVGESFTSEIWNQSNKYKGVVFISLKEKDLSGQEQRLNFSIINVGSHQNYSVGYSTVDMLFVQPGIYYIDHVRLVTHKSNNVSTIRELPQGGIDSNGIIKYGAFEVVAGQVYIIGDMIYSEKSEDFVQKINRTSFEPHLQDKEYQILLNSMKPGKFYKAGSIIYRDRNGNYKISDKKVINDHYLNNNESNFK
jgi:hypothetical protein